jgi:hypothetical protein
MTDFFVQLVVENLLKVLKTQVFHSRYFELARARALRVRACTLPYMLFAL